MVEAHSSQIREDVAKRMFFLAWDKVTASVQMMKELLSEIAMLALERKLAKLWLLSTCAGEEEKDWVLEHRVNLDIMYHVTSNMTSEETHSMCGARSKASVSLARTTNCGRKTRPPAARTRSAPTAGRQTPAITDAPA